MPPNSPVSVNSLATAGLFLIYTGKLKYAVGKKAGLFVKNSHPEKSGYLSAYMVKYGK